MNVNKVPEDFIKRVRPREAKEYRVNKNNTMNKLYFSSRRKIKLQQPEQKFVGEKQRWTDQCKRLKVRNSPKEQSYYL